MEFIILYILFACLSGMHYFYKAQCIPANMKEISPDPKAIWAFKRDAWVPYDLARTIRDRGWEGIHLVPVFEIPPELRITHHEFVLADGNRRRAAAEHLGDPLPSALYLPGERIDAQKDGVAPFSQSSHPRLYTMLLGMYTRMNSLSP
jgi:hypothetical protein